MGECDRPFLGSASGLTAYQLRAFRRLHRNVYVHAEARVSPCARAHAAALWAGDNGVLAGLSAAALHGSKWVDADLPAHLLRRGPRVSVPGICVRTDSLLPHESELLGGLQVTTAARTAFDLGRWLEHDEAVAMIDALCNATGLAPASVAAVAAEHAGARGLLQLRGVLALVDGGAESPPETRTRLLLIRAGLPAPRTQVRIADAANGFLARADMGWPRWRVAVEYDGGQHWDTEARRTRDIRRYAQLERLGWRVVRVNSQLLRESPGEVIANVRRALIDAGADLDEPAN